MTPQEQAKINALKATLVFQVIVIIGIIAGVIYLLTTFL